MWPPGSMPADSLTSAARTMGPAGAAAGRPGLAPATAGARLRASRQARSDSDLVETTRAVRVSACHRDRLAVIGRDTIALIG